MTPKLMTVRRKAVSVRVAVVVTRVFRRWKELNFSRIHVHQGR